MRVGSLFSGVGLGDFGLMLARMEIAWQVEIDDFCNKILELRWPGLPRWRDVKTVHGVVAHAEQHGSLESAEQGSPESQLGKGGNIESQRHNGASRGVCPNCLPSVDLIIGGPPCQPFSLAGKRSGMSDDRYLWPEMSRIVREVRPRWVVFENVPGVEKVVESVVVPDLESLSYQWWWLEIPAQALEACHRRMRVWVIAYTSQHLRRAPGNDGSESLDGGGNAANAKCPEWRQETKTADDQNGNDRRREEAAGGIGEPDWHRPPPEPTICGVDAKGTRVVDRLKSLGNGMDVRSAYEIGRMIMAQDAKGEGE